MNKFIYMDASATFLKSKSVIQAQMEFMQSAYANAGRGVCARAAAVDDMILKTRQKVAEFINADAENVVFTFGATDGFNRILNILKNTLGVWSKKTVCAGSDLDHHSLRGPFENSGCKFVVCPLNSHFDIDVKSVPESDILLITAMSNVIGKPQNVRAIIAAARKKNPNVITIVDCAQYVVHSDIDVKKWGCDFMCFSGHKIGADTGLGIMYIKNPDRFNVDKFGGGMVARIINKKWVLENAPYKFESGTLPISQIAGLSVAIDELKKHRPDMRLIEYMYDEIKKIRGVKMLSGPESKIVSFTLDNMNMLDFGAVVSSENICMRVGNMCASWIHNYLNISASARLSVGPWNTMGDAKTVVKIIKNKIEKYAK